MDSSRRWPSRGHAETLKLCKDCRWAKRFWSDIIIDPFHLGWTYARCCRPGSRRAEEMLPVDGRRGSGTFCSIERKYYYYTLDMCGPEGKYWEAK